MIPTLILLSLLFLAYESGKFFNELSNLKQDVEVRSRMYGK